MDPGPIDDLPIEPYYPDPWVQSVHTLIREMDQSVEIVIVEGKRDQAGLEAAGYTGSIIQCSNTAGIVPFAHQLDEEPIAILTDYDPAGRELNGKLRELIPARKVDAYWRRELGLLLTQRGRYEIEALNNIFGSSTLGPVNRSSGDRREAD